MRPYWVPAAERAWPAVVVDAVLEQAWLPAALEQREYRAWVEAPYALGPACSEAEAPVAALFAGSVDFEAAPEQDEPEATCWVWGLPGEPAFPAGSADFDSVRFCWVPPDLVCSAWVLLDLA